MANLLTSGIAVRLSRENDLVSQTQSSSMIRTTQLDERLMQVEKSVQTICAAPAGLISKLTAPERLIAQAIRERQGVRA